MRLFYLIFSLLIVGFVTTIGHAQNKGNSSQLYAYIEQSETTHLIVVDPAISLSDEVARYNYPVPSGWSLQSLILHEFNSELWSFAILSRGYGDTMFYVANLKTGFTREIPIAGYYFDHPEIVWSPNGQKVAFMASILDAQHGLDVHIYDLTLDALKTLTHSHVRYTGLAWSSDSSEIATFSHYCDVLEVCEGEMQSLHVFDVRTGLETDTFILPDGFQTPCNPLFSPQKDVIAFRSFCDSYIVGWFAASDVYLYNRQSKSLQRVTTFGDKALEGASEKYPFYAIYNYTWLDDQSLLVGADYRVITQEEGHQLLRYRTDGTTTILSNEIGAGFEVIPTTDRILLQSRSPQYQINPALQNDAIESFLIPKAELQTSINRIKTLQSISFPLTQPLVWSPDKTKAYGFVLETGADGYSSPTGEMAFFDAITQETHIDRLPADQPGEQNIIPAGWVSAEILP